jgi:hypothetical protein
VPSEADLPEKETAGYRGSLQANRRFWSRF